MLEEYRDAFNKKSPNFYLEGIKSALRRDELIIDFDMKFRSLEVAQSGRSTINDDVPTVPKIDFDVQTVNKLLQ